METETMGRVVTEAIIENLEDLILAGNGLRTAEQVRRVVVPDALVDTGATLLALPTRLIRELGLSEKYRKRVLSTTGAAEVGVYGPIRLTIQGRTCPLDATEVSDDVPVLIGQIPLEYLDLVVDPKNRRLIGNPDHAGEHMFELY